MSFIAEPPTDGDSPSLAHVGSTPLQATMKVIKTCRKQGVPLDGRPVFIWHNQEPQLWGSAWIKSVVPLNFEIWRCEPSPPGPGIVNGNHELVHREVNP